MNPIESPIDSLSLKERHNGYNEHMFIILLLANIKKYSISSYK